jgi:hypothetical protein
MDGIVWVTKLADAWLTCLHDSTDMSKMAQPKNATSRMKEME